MILAERVRDRYQRSRARQQRLLVDEAERVAEGVVDVEGAFAPGPLFDAAEMAVVVLVLGRKLGAGGEGARVHRLEVGDREIGLGLKRAERPAVVAGGGIREAESFHGGQQVCARDLSGNPLLRQVIEGARGRLLDERVGPQHGREAHRNPSPRATMPRRTSRVPPRRVQEGE